MSCYSVHFSLSVVQTKPDWSTQHHSTMYFPRGKNKMAVMADADQFYQWGKNSVPVVNISVV